MVLTNRNEMTWLAIQLAPLPYYRTDYSQLTQVLSFPYVRLIDFFCLCIETFLQLLNVFYASKNCPYVLY